MEKLRIREVLVVEGKYDAAKLTDLVDGLILTTGGFSIFSDPEKRDLIKKVGKERGLLVLTDSDAAGFRIRRYINQFASEVNIKNVYIPSVKGKEARKTAPSKEGLLGVEGIPSQVLYRALQEAGITPMSEKEGRKITYTDLFAFGISGTQGSAEKRRELLQRIGLPVRLSKKALLEVLNSFYTYEEFAALANPRPVLFWDFHGTLTTQDIIWFTAAEQALQNYLPQVKVSREIIEKNFSKKYLPWWCLPHHDTRSLVEEGKWWAFCAEQFVTMYETCGLSHEEAKFVAPHIREFVLRPEGFYLYPDVEYVLSTLQRHGYRNVILSNNFPELDEIVEGLGLNPYIEQVISSARVGFEKPRKELFDYALQVTHAERGIMLGDSTADDICGAKAAGWQAIAVHHSENVPQADLTVNELKELLPYFSEN